MSTDFQSPRRRARSDDALKRRRALHAAKPFMELFPAWQQRAAFISAALLAHSHDTEQRALQMAALDDLVAEVETARDRFDTVTMSENRHGRLEDVRNAFRRLLEILRAAGAGRS